MKTTLKARTGSNNEAEIKRQKTVRKKKGAEKAVFDYNLSERTVWIKVRNT